MADISRMLKLQARDAEDLAVISALLQDALVPPGDIEYLADQGCFVLAANRYRWEAEEREVPGGERILCGLVFANVTAVRRRNIDLLARGAYYNFLSVEPVDGTGDGAREGGKISPIELTFSNGAAIRLEISELSCTLEDFGEAWPTAWRPIHE